MRIHIYLCCREEDLRKRGSVKGVEFNFLCRLHTVHLQDVCTVIHTYVLYLIDVCVRMMYGAE